MSEKIATKDKVLAILKAEEDYLSGETIGERLHVSRAAVSGAVVALREEGYDIRAVTNRGYRIEHAPDRLTGGEVFAHLASDLGFDAGEARMARVVCVDTVDSTNRMLAQMALDGAADGTVAIADMQTAGRGRMGRPFSSPGGMGVYFSYLIRPEQGTDAGSAAAWTGLTSKTAVAVSDAVEQVTGLRPQIKWVNDLYLEGKKISGILTQMDLDAESAGVRSIVVGIGVNVNEQMTDFPEEIREIAGSLHSVTGRKYARAALAAKMVQAMDALRMADADAEKAYLARYRADSFLPGMDVTVIQGGEKRAAHVLSVADDYALCVRYADGTEERLRGGEVSVTPDKK